MICCSYNRKIIQGPVEDRGSVLDGKIRQQKVDDDDRCGLRARPAPFCCHHLSLRILIHFSEGGRVYQ